MPQLDFYLCEKERVEVLDFAFKNGFRIIPSCDFLEKKYKVIDDINFYTEFGRETPLLFLVNSKFSEYPLEFDSFKSDDGITKYYLKQRRGGPTIDFFSPVIGEIEEKVVGPGFIGIYPFYYHGEKKFVPKRQLAEQYSTLVSYIKSITIKISFGKRIYWVGKDTVERVKQKEFHIEPIADMNIIDILK